jgi:hypothetical protein
VARVLVAARGEKMNVVKNIAVQTFLDFTVYARWRGQSEQCGRLCACR